MLDMRAFHILRPGNTLALLRTSQATPTSLSGYERLDPSAHILVDAIFFKGFLREIEYFVAVLE